jgi:POLQ-like helicase
MGRAGRAGMHTEGLVVFADPRNFDGKMSKLEGWRFKNSVALLDPELAEDTTSALLALISPFQGGRKNVEISLDAERMLDLLYGADNSEREAWANGNERQYGKDIFTAKELLAELHYRRRVIVAVESFLMANRGTSSLEDYMRLVETWAKATLAYSLADDAQKAALLILFERVADYVNSVEPSTERQVRFAKTLLGVDSARRIDEWVVSHRDTLLALDSTSRWLDLVWELFVAEVDDDFFTGVEPSDFSQEVVRRWIKGDAYKTLLNLTKSQKATKPYGKSQRSLTDDDVLDFLESTLGFRCSLVVAAVGQSLFGGLGADAAEAEVFSLFQKSLKYGLPDRLAISIFERGFADRAVASDIRDALLAVHYPHSYVSAALRESRSVIVDVLKNYPSYFETVLSSF